MAAVMMAAGVMALDDIQVTGKNKMAFTVGGPEERYNQIRVINHTSLPNTRIIRSMTPF